MYLTSSILSLKFIYFLNFFCSDAFILMKRIDAWCPSGGSPNVWLSKCVQWGLIPHFIFPLFLHFLHSVFPPGIFNEESVAIPENVTITEIIYSGTPTLIKHIDTQEEETESGSLLYPFLVLVLVVMPWGHLWDVRP